jgi:hypothetical protein
MHMLDIPKNENVGCQARAHWLRGQGFCLLFVIVSRVSVIVPGTGRAKKYLLAEYLEGHTRM